MKLGLIVVLNGISSSGKTSTSNSLINQSDMDFMHLSLDEFATGMLQGYKGWLNSRFHRLNQVIGDGGNQKLADVIVRPIISMYNSTIKSFSELGVNVIVDHVVGIDGEWLSNCVNLLNGHPIVFVGLKCSLEELERREKIRGNRHLGVAKLQFDKIHTRLEYDLELNTDDLSQTNVPDLLSNLLNRIANSRHLRNYLQQRVREHNKISRTAAVQFDPGTVL